MVALLGRWCGAFDECVSIWVYRYECVCLPYVLVDWLPTRTDTMNNNMYIFFQVHSTKRFVWRTSTRTFTSLPIRNTNRPWKRRRYFNNSREFLPSNTKQICCFCHRRKMGRSHGLGLAVRGKMFEKYRLQRVVTLLHRQPSKCAYSQTLILSEAKPKP